MCTCITNAELRIFNELEKYENSEGLQNLSRKIMLSEYGCISRLLAIDIPDFIAEFDYSSETIVLTITHKADNKKLLQFICSDMKVLNDIDLFHIANSCVDKYFFGNTFMSKSCVEIREDFTNIKLDINVFSGKSFKMNVYDFNLFNSHNLFEAYIKLINTSLRTKLLPYNSYIHSPNGDEIKQSIYVKNNYFIVQIAKGSKVIADFITRSLKDYKSNKKLIKKSLNILNDFVDNCNQDNCIKLDTLNESEINTTTFNNQLYSYLNNNAGSLTSFCFLIQNEE